MEKSQNIAKSPEVVISFLEYINLFPPKQKVISIFFLLFYAAFFSNQIKQNLTSVLSFFVFSKEETQKTKNEIRLPFYRFSFYVQTNTKNGKTKNDFRFIVFSFYVRENTKTEKQKSTTVLSLFVFVRTNTKNEKNDK